MSYMPWINMRKITGGNSKRRRIWLQLKKVHFSRTLNFVALHHCAWFYYVKISLSRHYLFLLMFKIMWRLLQYVIINILFMVKIVT